MTDPIGGGGNSDLARLMAMLNAQAAQRSDPFLSQSDDSSGTGCSCDTITLSKTAQAASAMWTDAASAANPLLSLGTPQQSDLDSLLSQAQSGLQKIMDNLGISSDFQFTLTVQPDGSVKVNSDDPRAAQLQDAINNDPDLRNALVGVHVMSVMQRIAAATGQALDGAQSNENQASDYFQWVRGVIDQTKTADQVFTMSGGKLTTSFVDANGNQYGVTDGLTLGA